MTNEEIVARAIVEAGYNPATAQGITHFALAAISSAGRLVGEFNEDEAIAKLAYAMWDADDTDKLTRPEDNARMMKRARGVWDWYGPYVRWIAASAPHPAHDAPCKDCTGYWYDDGVLRCDDECPAPDATDFCGADPFENGYTPAAVEKMYRDRLTAAQAENKKLRSTLKKLLNDIDIRAEAYRHSPSEHIRRHYANVPLSDGVLSEARALSPPPLSPEK